MKLINSELLDNILKEIENNPRVTEFYLAEKYFVCDRTIRRYIKILKDKKKIMLKNYGRKKIWQVISK